MTPLAQLLARLPRVGEAMAERLSRSMAEQPEDWRRALARLVLEGTRVNRCPVCHDRLDPEPCGCQLGPVGSILVVATPEIRRVVTRALPGRWHVLGGLLPHGGQEGIRALLERCRDPAVTEVLLALGPEGKATEDAIAQSLRGSGIEVWALGRGIGFGREIEHATEAEIVEALAHRVPASC